MSVMNIKFLDGESGEKVLGSVWNNRKDVFTYKIKSNELPSKVSTTKRNILSRVARVFDPIGFTAAYLIRAKIGLQRLWQKRYNWNEVLPTDVKKLGDRIFQRNE